MEAPLFFLNYLFPAAKDSVGQWSWSEVDGRFVAFTAVCCTHGCVQLCEDAKAVRVSPVDAAVYVCVLYVLFPSVKGGVLYVHRHDLQSNTGITCGARSLKMLSYRLLKRISCAVMYDVK